MEQQRVVTVHDDTTGELIGAVCQRPTGFEAWLRLRYHDRRAHILLAIDDQEATAVQRIKDRMTERQALFNRIWADIKRGTYIAVAAKTEGTHAGPALVPSQVSDDTTGQLMSIPVADGTELLLVARRPGQLWWKRE